MKQRAQNMVQSRKDVEQLICSHSQVLRSLGIEGISLFGSFQRDTGIRTDSDVDFVVEFIPGRKSYDTFFDLATYLEGMLGRDVDLLTRESLRSEAGRRIWESSVRIAI